MPSGAGLPAGLGQQRPGLGRIVLHAWGLVRVPVVRVEVGEIGVEQEVQVVEELLVHQLAVGEVGQGLAHADVLEHGAAQVEDEAPEALGLLVVDHPSWPPSPS